MIKFRIILREKVNEELLNKIKTRHKNDIDGLIPLYDQLIKQGTCDSTRPAEIYYLAYTLALEDLNIIIMQVNN